MGTLKKSVQVATKYEEFLAYDEQGHAVVLRRNTDHPGAAAVPATQSSMQVRPATERILNEGKSQSTGSLGFFSGFDEVRARLQAKGLCASRSR